MNDRDALLEAATLIEGVVAKLDRRESHCDCCNRDTYANWDHEQAARQLQPMVVKLRGYANGKIFREDS